MTVSDFAKLGEFQSVCIPSPERKINGAYVGDLLSWVMGKAEPDNVWITIMSNLNIVAVATLADISVIVLAEGVMPDADALEAAKAKGINILATKLSSYDVSIKISEIIS